MSQPITLHVNGRAVTVSVHPETPLVYVLRNDLGLTSPKVGCSQEQCFACAVLVDGAAVPSCRLPVQQVAGLEITTVEGLGSAGEPHPLQEAFMEEQALQCGYCTAGMLIAAQGLLNRQRYPSDAEIRDALGTNLCRCGVYDRVRRAVKLRVGRPDARPRFTVLTPSPLPPEWTPPLPTGLSPSLHTNPQLDNWIRINADETVTVFTGKVEIGQGLRTAVAQIAAEELDVALTRIQVVDGDTAQTPDEGITAGSQSMETSGRAVRQAAADARYHLLALAHEALDAAGPMDQLEVEDGLVTDPVSGRQVSYWTIFGGQRFGVDVTGVGAPKPVESYRIVGQPARRLDLPAKVSGVPSYVHDLELPDLVHGRVVRPPTYTARLIAVDLAPVEAMPGVLVVVRDGAFLGVIAAREEQALAAADRLAALAQWDDPASLPDPERIFDHLLEAPAQSFLVQEGTAVEAEIPPLCTGENAVRTVQARYFRPFQMHASLGPSAALAHLVDGALTVWVQTQGVFPQRAVLAQVLGMTPEQIHVVHVEGAGCYGHNGAEDAALDAALLARALPGRPVSLKWTRANEHQWEPYAPAMVMELQADLDADGAVVAWNHDVWSHSHVTRPRATEQTPGKPGESGLLAAWHLAEPFAPQPPRTHPGRHFGEYRNADPIYDLPVRRIVSHFVRESPLRTSAFRSLGAYGNVFAIESFMDELAYAAGVDPVEFRLRHLRNPRARAVIEAAAEASNWQARTTPTATGRGQGFAFAQYKNIQCYAAVVVDLTVDGASGAVQLEQALIAADAGQVVNPDGLSNQLEGGFLQAASMTLCEEVRFDAYGITSRDWDSYPILRFPGAPVVQTVLLNRPTLPFLGSGEAAIGPTPGALANAIFHATGARLRRIPFTPGRVRAALDAPR